MREARVLELNQATELDLVDFGQHPQDGMAPPEARGPMDSRLFGSLSNGACLGHALVVARPASKSLGIGQRCSCEVAKRTPAVAAAVALPQRESAPSVHLIGTATRTPDTSRETCVADRAQK